MPKTRPDSAVTAPNADLRAKILETASSLFYKHGVRAVGVDWVVKEAGVAKTSLYRHFGTKDDLIAAFLSHEDLEFWRHWDTVSTMHVDDPRAELTAHMEWIGVRSGRVGYRGCPQINVAAEFPEEGHPARLVAAEHKLELRRRLTVLAVALDAVRPEELGGQLAVLINGAFVSTQMFQADEAPGLLQRAGDALVQAALDVSRQQL